MHTDTLIIRFMARLIAGGMAPLAAYYVAADAAKGF